MQTYKEYRVTKDFGDLKEGAIVRDTDFNSPIDDLIIDGTLVEIPVTSNDIIDSNKEAKTITKPIVDEPVVETPAEFFLAGKKIISESTRIVEDREFITVRTEDGSTFDLTEEEYKLQVKNIA